MAFDWTTLLAGPLGGVLGFAGSLVQKWQDRIDRREAHAQKLAELEIVSKIDLQKADILFRQTVEEKAGESFKAAIDAQAQLRGVGKVSSNILALFRPGLTSVLIIASVALAILYRESKPELLDYVIVSMFGMASVACGYWFGVRTEEKFRVQAAFPTLKKP